MKLGMTIPFLTLEWADGSEQAFTAQWLDRQGDPLPLDDSVYRITIHAGGGDVTFDAVNSPGGFTTWTIAEVDSLAEYIGRACRLDLIYDGTTVLLARGRVVPA